MLICDWLMCVSLTGKRVVGRSNLSKYLVVKALHDKEPIIGQCGLSLVSILSFFVVVVVFKWSCACVSSGLDAVMECRGISQDTFFMCVSCAVTLSSRHICEHIVTVGHQYCYIVSHDVT